MANEYAGTDFLTWLDDEVETLLGGLGEDASRSITFLEQTSEAYDPTAASANVPVEDDQGLGVCLLTDVSAGEPAVGGTLVFLVARNVYEAAYGAGARPQQDAAFTLGSGTYEVAKVSAPPTCSWFRVEAMRVG